MSPSDAFDSSADIYHVHSHAPGTSGRLPLTEEMLIHSPSGDIFGLSLNAGMGWNPADAGRKQFLILSTSGGLRAPDGKPDRAGLPHRALGNRAAGPGGGRGIRADSGPFPSPAFVPIPATGRTQGTPGMFDSLPYRNDAAVVFRRLARSLPLRAGVLGVATCDKGLPAMMMARGRVARSAVRRRPRRRHACRPTAGKMPARCRPWERVLRTGPVTLAEARGPGLPRLRVARRAAASFSAPPRPRRWSARRWDCPCRTRRSRRPASRCGCDMARRSARALHRTGAAQAAHARILTPASIRNAMTVHAAFGGSTNLLLHIPAIAHAAGLEAAGRRGLDLRQPPRPAAGERAAQRPGPSSHRPRLPGRRRARGHAAPAPTGVARARRAHRHRRNPGRKPRSVGKIRTPRSVSAESLQQQDGVDAGRSDLLA